MLRLPIEWDGPHSWKKVVRWKRDGGESPSWDGDDYGLYQIYGRHILGDRKALLYIGKTTQQTFGDRFGQHEEWLVHEWPGVEVYLGRLFLPRRHKPGDRWASWERDVLLAERILIYKYSPHYNSVSIAERPSLDRHNRVELLHLGERNRLKRHDVAPEDWE